MEDTLMEWILTYTLFTYARSKIEQALLLNNLDEYAGTFLRSSKTLKEYERARVEFDAYRTDLEKMQLQSGPSEPPNHQIKLEESTKSFKARKERLDKLKERLKIRTRSTI